MGAAARIFRDEVGIERRANLLHFKLVPWFQPIVLFLLACLVFSGLVFSELGFVSTDDYYHARISEQMLAQGRLRVDFPVLPRTILSSERFVDHHLLFHIYVAPWIYWGGETGAKLASVTIAAGVLVAVWLLLRQIGVRWPAAWSLGLLAVSAPFLYRMLMLRAQGAALLLIVIALMLLFARRDRWMVALAFAYAWLYNGFVLILGVSALYAAAVWFAERRLRWQPVVYTALGLALGLIINPYFPTNLIFIADHLGAKVDFESGIRVGREWYPYNADALLTHAGGALGALAFGVLRPSFRARRRDAIETALLLIAFMTLFMLLRSRRFIEYFPAFALLFCAAAWGRGGPALAEWLPVRRLRALVPYAALVGLLLLIGLTVRAASDQIRSSIDGDYLAGAGGWLAAHAEPGAPIFQTDWDDFTRLYYYHPTGEYVVGLDPTYLQIADPDLWDTWVAVTRGQVEQPSAIIRERFGSAYVVSDLGHEAFIRQADRDPGLQLVYRDANALIWRVLPRD